MAKTNFKNIDEYHSSFSGDILKRMELTRKIINQIVPEAEEVISYQIPAFKIGKKFLLYYAGFPNHLSLSHPWSQDFLEHFKDELKDYKVSKSVIQIPNENEFPEEFVEKIIRFRREELKETV
ncbi:iron chaperone [Sphingobacterium sp. 1.A.5]|uniref:iron chaperone n=1 Tax=Sphingobacterium sp. 1.A.5 TaxID=2044604 RepID=UPI000C0BEF03|nr:DUF1801 domain-containing protein [Sphingobacterium sp. 1.A.5]